MITRSLFCFSNRLIQSGTIKVQGTLSDKKHQSTSKDFYLFRTICLKGTQKQYSPCKDNIFTQPERLQKQEPKFGVLIMITISKYLMNKRCCEF